MARTARYRVEIGGRVHTIEVVETKEGLAVRDGDWLVPVDVRTLVGTRRLSILAGQESIEAALWRDGDRLILLVDGQLVEARVEDELSSRFRKLAGQSRHLVEHQTVRAPMPGLVSIVHVAPGELVGRSQSLLVLEAMKMENEIRAPVDGVIERVVVEAGQTVELGQVLVVIRPNE